MAYADLIEALLAREGVTRYHLVAHDLGDSVAQELLARKAPIVSATLLNGGLFPETHRALLRQKLLASPIGPQDPYPIAPRGISEARMSLLPRLSLRLSQPAGWLTWALLAAWFATASSGTRMRVMDARISAVPCDAGWKRRLNGAKPPAPSDPCPRATSQHECPRPRALSSSQLRFPCRR